MPELEIVSDNCFDTTGAISAGLPGLTIGEQIGGMWKSIAMQPSSGESMEGVITSILIAANIVVEPIFANAEPSADATAPRAIVVSLALPSGLPSGLIDSVR